MIKRPTGTCSCIYYPRGQGSIDYAPWIVVMVTTSLLESSAWDMKSPSRNTIYKRKLIIRVPLQYRISALILKINAFLDARELSVRRKKIHESIQSRGTSKSNACPLAICPSPRDLFIKLFLAVGYMCWSAVFPVGNGRGGGRRWFFARGKFIFPRPSVVLKQGGHNTEVTMC